MRKYFTYILTAVLSTASSYSMADGQVLYQSCVGCHGANGEGNEALKSPAIGGLPSWYSERQLSNFLNDKRGTQDGDVLGAQMRQMAKATLKDEGQVKELSVYISQLKPVSSQLGLGGDINRGKKLYEPCIVCHGVQGEGQERASAPPLRGQQDWYIAQQINNFKNEFRGYHKDDRQGKTMVVLMKLLPGAEDVNDVASYIGSMSGH